MNTGKKLLWRSLYVCFGINFLLLLLSIVAPYLNPKYFWPPSFIKLFFFIWFFLHGAFLLFFIFKRKYVVMCIAFVGLLCTIPALSKLYAFHPLTHNTSHEHQLRIMTYNVMGFGWYAKKKDAFAILKNIREQHPDIICLQEYLARYDDKFKIMDTLIHRYGYKYYQEHTVVKSGKNYYFGEAVFSKIPLNNYKGIPFHNSLTNGAFYVDVPWGKDTVRLINVHFQSFSLKPREYNWEDTSSIGKLSRFQLLKISLYKMRKAFRKKSFQTDEVRKIVDASPFPVILCGDFNDTPLSYTYSKLTETLEDAFLATNNGLGTTYAGNLPYLRIDYILHDKKLKATYTHVRGKFASDHYPLLCDFQMK